MALPSEWKRTATSRQLWASALVLCPVSYLATILIRYSPVAGGMAALFVAVSLAEVATEREPRKRLAGPRALLAGASAAVIVGATAFSVGRVSAGVAVLFALAVLAQVTFVWFCVPMLRRDLGGGEFDATACARGEMSVAENCSRTALAFALFFSLLMLGAGALWNRGEPWAPSPALWVLVLLALAVGAMLLERLGFLERSARHGNLTMPRYSHRRWIAGAMVVLLIAGLLAAAGPWRPLRPHDTSRAGTKTVEQPTPITPHLRQQMERVSAAISAAGSAAANVPRPMVGLWLLLLLLLIALVLVWLFSRSRAAYWLLWLVGWLVTRAAKAWQWLRARLSPAKTQDSLRGAPSPVSGSQDPFFDIFAHPDLLGVLSQREIILRTYHLFLSLAEVCGKPRRLNQTPLEYAGSLEMDDSEARAALDKFTWNYAHAMYGGAAAELPAPGSVQALWASIAGALTRHISSEELTLRKQVYLEGRRRK